MDLGRAKLSTGYCSSFSFYLTFKSYSMCHFILSCVAASPLSIPFMSHMKHFELSCC